MNPSNIRTVPVVSQQPNRSFYGRIDVKRLPPPGEIRELQLKATRKYRRHQNETSLTRERYIMEETWRLIADYQETERSAQSELSEV